MIAKGLEELHRVDSGNWFNGLVIDDRRGCGSHLYGFSRKELFDRRGRMKEGCSVLRILRTEVPALFA